MSIFKLFYHIVAGLMSRLHVYEKRTGKYFELFKHHYVSNARVIVDVGYGAGAFSKALALQERLVIALDIEERLLRGIENPYIEKVCADAHHLSLRDGSVDCVLSHFLNILKTRRSVWKSFTER